MAATAATAARVVTVARAVWAAQQLGIAMPLKALLEAQVERVVPEVRAALVAAAATAAPRVWLEM